MRRRSINCSTPPPTPASAPRWRARRPSGRGPPPLTLPGMPPRLRIAVSKTGSGAYSMNIGASIFFTEYSISPTELGAALEEGGFDSLWVAEHSHIPVTRRFNVPTGGGCNQAAQARHRRVPGNPARHDPDRQARRLARSGLGRAFHLRHRRRLERRGDGGSWHGLRDPVQETARADRGDEGDLDQGEAGISRRDR